MAPKTGYQRKWPVGFRKWCAFKGLPVNSGTLQIYQGVLQAKQQQKLHGSPGFPGLSLPSSYTTPARTAGGGGGGGAPRKRPRDPTDNPFNDPVPTNITFPPDQYPVPNRMAPPQAHTSGAIGRYFVRGKRARKCRMTDGNVLSLLRRMWFPTLRFLATSYGSAICAANDFLVDGRRESDLSGAPFNVRLPRQDLNPILGQLCAPANDGSLRLVYQFCHNEMSDVQAYLANACKNIPFRPKSQNVSSIWADGVGENFDVLGTTPGQDKTNRQFDSALCFNGGSSLHRFHNDLNVIQKLKIYEVWARELLPAGNTPLECWTRDLGRLDLLNNGDLGDFGAAHSSVYNYYHYPSSRTNRELHRKYHVCKPHSVTLAPGQSLTYKLKLNGFKFDESYFKQSLAIGAITAWNDGDPPSASAYSADQVYSSVCILPGKTKFLIVISEGERMHLPMAPPTRTMGRTIQTTDPNIISDQYFDEYGGAVHLYGGSSTTAAEQPNPNDVRLPNAVTGATNGGYPGMFVPGGDVNNKFLTEPAEVDPKTSTLDPWTGNAPDGVPFGIGRCYVQLSHIQIDRFAYSAVPNFKKFNLTTTGVNLDLLGGLPQAATRIADVTIDSINNQGTNVERA